MSAIFKNSKKKVSQMELRKFMNEHKTKQKAIKKIISPLAKYNDQDQLTCVLCKSIVRSEAVWTVHVNAKVHKQNVEIAKELKEKTNNFTTLKRRLTPPLIDASEKKIKSILKNSNNVDQDENKTNYIKNDHLPDNFFDANEIKKNNTPDNKRPFHKKHEMMETEDISENKDVLPEGFFDDPKLDAKARNQEYKNPIEEEWEKFVKAIKEADSESSAIIAEDQEEATIERQIVEIDEQMKKLSRKDGAISAKAHIYFMLVVKKKKRGAVLEYLHLAEIRSEEFVEIITIGSKNTGRRKRKMAEKQQNLFYVKPFDGNFYSNWEYRVKLLLEQQEVLYVLTEEQREQTNTSEVAKWKKADVKARTIIIQCLSDNILESVKTKLSAAEIMKSLEHTYAKKGISTQVMLQKKLRGLKYIEGTPLRTFLTEFDNTVSELKTAGGKMDQEELILQLLSTMPESFQSVTTAIDVMFCQNQTAIDIEFVKNKLLMEEARQEKVKEGGCPNMTFVSRHGRGNWKNYGNFRGNQRGNLNRGGSMSNSNANSGNHVENYGHFPFKCHLCNKVGHKRADCQMNKGMRGSYSGQRGGFMKRGNGNAYSAQESTEEGDTDGHISFLTSEYSMLTANENNISFVIDSGATNHLVRSDLFKYLKDIKNIDHKINVAKQGQTMVAKYQGSLELESETEN
ncbi:uncharacterized protein LOC108914856 [Anoplophora glabripennis]|nr:uncharacterized protein LOC108914856 [Anoplophora glabripennis]